MKQTGRMGIRVLLSIIFGFFLVAQESIEDVRQCRENFQFRLMFNPFRNEASLLQRSGALESIIQQFCEGYQLDSASWHECFLGKREKGYYVADERIAIESFRSPCFSFKYLYTIDNAFREAGPFALLDGRVYFHRPGRFCRINDMQWYDPLPAVKGDCIFKAAGKIWAFRAMHPRKMKWTEPATQKSGNISLSGFRNRLEVFPLGDDLFVSRNFRAIPEDFAVELFDISGRRLREFFQWMPARIDRMERTPLASGTLVTTNGRDRIYACLQLPGNPYYVWIYDRDGKRVQVLGQYLEDKEEYSFPMEWIDMDREALQRIGLRKLYTMERLLVTPTGHLLVFFSRRKIYGMMEAGDGPQENSIIFADLFGPDGTYLGRAPFDHGIPEVIDPQGRIYCTERTGEIWKITVVEFILR